MGYDLYVQMVTEAVAELKGEPVREPAEVKLDLPVDANQCTDNVCTGCADYVTNGGTLCEGTSTDLYNALVDCTCAGACKDICTDNVCAGLDVTTDCQNCVIDSAAGCGMEFGECSNDF